LSMDREKVDSLTFRSESIRGFKMLAHLTSPYLNQFGYPLGIARKPLARFSLPGIDAALYISVSAAEAVKPLNALLAIDGCRVDHRHALQPRAIFEPPSHG
jgi:hypothetical protein